MFSLHGVQHRMWMKTCTSSLSEETELLQGGFGLSCGIGLFSRLCFPASECPFGSNLIIP